MNLSGSLKGAPTELKERTTSAFMRDRLGLATLVVDSKCRQVFKSKTIDFGKQSSEFFSPKTMRNLYDNQIRPKFIIKPDGKLLIVYADPEWTNHYIQTEVITKDENDDASLKIELDVLKLNKIYISHFQGRDAGVMVQDIIHFKGPGDKMIQIQ